MWKIRETFGVKASSDISAGGVSRNSSKCSTPSLSYQEEVLSKQNWQFLYDNKKIMVAKWGGKKKKQNFLLGKCTSRYVEGVCGMTEQAVRRVLPRLT